MTTATKVKTNKRANATSKITKIKHEVANNNKIELYGEIVYWQIPGSRSATTLQNALISSGLPANKLREIYPSSAFSRVAHQLTEEGIFDRLDRQGRELVFQLTEKAIRFNHTIGEKELEFSRKAYLRLDTETGSVTSQSHPDLAVKMEKLIRDVQSQRTPTEIGGLIKALLDDEIDIFPLCEGSKTYFAPDSSKEFLNKISKFCNEIGATLHRLPMIKDSGTRQSVAAAIEIGINQMIKDHMTNIENLDLNCRADTIEKQYDCVQATEVRMLVYKNILKEKTELLQASLEEARDAINRKKMELQQFKNESLLCTVKVSTNKCLIWGYSVSKMAKYLRYTKQWDKVKVVKLCKNLFGSYVSGPSIEVMASVNKGYDDVSLTDKQLQQLDDVACSSPDQPIVISSNGVIQEDSSTSAE